MFKTCFTILVMKYFAVFVFKTNNPTQNAPIFSYIIPIFYHLYTFNYIYLNIYTIVQLNNSNILFPAFHLWPEKSPDHAFQSGRRSGLLLFTLLTIRYYISCQKRLSHLNIKPKKSLRCPLLLYTGRRKLSPYMTAFFQSPVFQ